VDWTQNQIRNCERRGNVGSGEEWKESMGILRIPKRRNDVFAHRNAPD
jgi:hypothetical protein